MLFLHDVETYVIKKGHMINHMSQINNLRLNIQTSPIKLFIEQQQKVLTLFSFLISAIFI